MKLIWENFLNNKGRKLGGRKNDKERRLDLLFEEKRWMSSLEFAMEAIVSELLKRNFIN